MMEGIGLLRDSLLISISKPVGIAHTAYFPTADGSLYFRGDLKEVAFGQIKVEDRDTDETTQQDSLDERRPFVSEDERCAMVAELDPSEHIYQVEVEANVPKESKTLECVLEVGKLSGESISLEGETLETVQASELQKASGKKAAYCTPEKQSSRLPLLKGVCMCVCCSVVLLKESKAAKTTNDFAHLSLLRQFS